MKNKQKIVVTQQGFTIIELLLYMGIFSMLLLVLMQIFTSILSVHAESQATSQVDQDGTYILTRLSNDIHKASTVVEPTLGSTCLPTCPTTMRITGSGGFDETITQSGNDLTLNGTPLNSADTTVTVTFLTLGNVLSPTPPGGAKNSVQIQLTVTSKTVQPGGKQQKKSFQTTIQTR
jgi:type II secretory pathway pseudopilin PulG